MKNKKTQQLRENVIVRTRDPEKHLHWQTKHLCSCTDYNELESSHLGCSDNFLPS